VSRWDGGTQIRFYCLGFANINKNHRVMAAALDHFTDRLKAGAKADLLDLAKITFVKSRTA